MLALVLPIVILVVLTRVDLLDAALAPGERRIDLAAPGVLALCVLSTSFTGVAIATGFERRYGVLRMLATTPLGRSGLLAGKIIGVGAMEAVQFAVIGGVAAWLGWRPDLAGLPGAVLAVVLGTAALTACGLLMAGTLPAEVTLAAANLVWVLLVAGGGMLVVASQLPAPLGALAGWLPSGALAAALRTSLVTGGFAAAAPFVLVLWAAAAWAACLRWFRWS
jgi:ABC-2 type transport system permease protein